MTLFPKLRLLAAGAIAGLCLTPSAFATETLKMAHVYEPGEAFNTWAVWAAEEIGKRTGNRYKIDVFPASQLGSEAEINEGLGLGAIDIIYTSPVFSATAYPPIAISDAPYMFRDFDHWKAYSTSPLFKTLSDGYYEAAGNEVLALGYYGSRHVTTNKPVKTPEDMKDMKLRVPGAPLFKLFPEAVGAKPTPIAFAEVYLALQQKVVDGQENPLPTIKAKKFYEVQSDISLTGHITNSILTVMSGSRWEGLSDEDKKIFAEVFREAAEQCTDDIRKQESDLVEWFRSQGVNVNEVDRPAFLAAVQPHLNGPEAGWTKEQYDELQALGK